MIALRLIFFWNFVSCKHQLRLWQHICVLLEIGATIITRLEVGAHATLESRAHAARASITSLISLYSLVMSRAVLIHAYAV